MTDEQTVLDAAQAAVKGAQSAGAEWADAGAVTGRSLSVSAERNTIRESEVSYYRGVGVRAFVRGGMGLAQTAGLDAEAAARVGRQAAELALSASPDPDFRRLPEPAPIPASPAVFDDEVAGLPAERLVEWCVQIIERGGERADQVFVGGGAHVAFGTSAVASSTGILASERRTDVGVYAYANVWDGDRAASFGDGTGASRLADLRWDDLPERVVVRAASLVHDEHVETGRRDVVLDYKPAYQWLWWVLACADAESVQRKRSFMTGKEGEQIASSVLTVVEDPFIVGGRASSACDGEGVPRQRRNLLDAGVLTTYLHNSYTANKAGVPYTGHASRGGYGGHVGVGMSNLLVEPGGKPLADLIRDVEDGIFIVSGSPMPDRTTGQVSSTVDGGFVIRNGEILHPVKGAMLAGDIFEFLASVDAVSSDYEQEPGRIMPAVRLRDVMVSAQ